ncbi:MAG: hypothetical protein RL662_2104 [Bacteroidota bacterium]|jgi:uncharacterized membrane protein YphA (DoxX/SURF4 family)
MSRINNILIKVIVEVSRILLGVTFIFSGFVKSIDPLGTVYKIQDYFTAFGLVNINWLAFPTAIVLCSVEFCLGIFIFMGLYRKWTSRILFIVMLFMTPLTLYLAIYDPVKDCGCFGDALIITNWETFFKNVILLIASIATLIWCEKITNLFTGKFYWLVALYIIVFGAGFCLYNYYNEPLIDFRPYKVGNNIGALMTVDKDKAPVYENFLVYEKGGVKKEFTESDYPWQDSSWIFVDRVSKLVKDGEKPLIQDLAINRLYLNPAKTEIEDEEDITAEVLSDSSYTFLMIAYSLTEMSEQYLSRFEDVNNYARDHKYKFYCLTASPRDSIIQLEKENITNFDFAMVDERVLKTMVRSNPGLILLKNGVVINKWAASVVPDEGQLTNAIDELSISQMPDTSRENKKQIYYLLIILFAPILGVKIFDALLYHRKKVDINPDIPKSSL